MVGDWVDGFGAQEAGALLPAYSANWRVSRSASDVFPRPSPRGRFAQAAALESPAVCSGHRCLHAGKIPSIPFPRATCMPQASYCPVSRCLIPGLLVNRADLSRTHQLFRVPGALPGTEAIVLRYRPGRLVETGLLRRDCQRRPCSHRGPGLDNVPLDRAAVSGHGRAHRQAPRKSGRARRSVIPGAVLFAPRLSATPETKNPRRFPDGGLLSSLARR